MRILLFLVLLIAGGAALLLQADGNVPIAPDAGAGDVEREHRPDAPAAPERVDVTPAPRGGDADASRPDATDTGRDEDEPAAPTPPAPPTLPPVTVQLHVRSMLDQQDVAPFRWRFVLRGHSEHGDSEGARAELRLPAGATGELLVEADGMQPFSRSQLTIPTPPQAPLPLDVFLTPTPQGTGITLLVRDLAQRPIRHVRVDAFELGDHNRETSWQLGQPLWSRAASAEDGNYELPPLPAGEYGVLLLATDEQGRPLPLLPFRRAFALTGSNGFVEDVPLEPGCHLVLDMVEPNGDAFDPEVHGRITLGLRPAGAPPFERMWTSGGEGGALQRALNAMPAKGVVWADEPLPAGAYTFEVFVNGDPRVQQTLVLRAGEVQTERIVVR